MTKLRGLKRGCVRRRGWGTGGDKQGEKDGGREKTKTMSHIKAPFYGAGKMLLFFIPTGRGKTDRICEKEGRFFKFVETGEVDAPVFTRVENPGIMGEKHGRGWARMDQTQRALLSTLYERWYGVLHRYAQWAVGDALLAEEIVQETFLAAVPKIRGTGGGGTSGAGG